MLNINQWEHAQAESFKFTFNIRFLTVSMLENEHMEDMTKTGQNLDMNDVGIKDHRNRGKAESRKIPSADEKSLAKTFPGQQYCFSEM